MLMGLRTAHPRTLQQHAANTKSTNTPASRNTKPTSFAAAGGVNACAARLQAQPSKQQQHCAGTHVSRL